MVCRRLQQRQYTSSSHVSQHNRGKGSVNIDPVPMLVSTTEEEGGARRKLNIDPVPML